MDNYACRFMMVDRIYCASIVLILSSIAFLLSGILLIAFSDSLIKKTVKKECQLKQGTVVYKIWHDSPVPLYISIYVFDLANEIEFLNGGKPNLIQRGPFVYKEQRTKEDIRFYPNGTISYRESRNYTFDRSKSISDETFSFNTINVVYMTLINYLHMENVPDLFRQIIGTILSFVEKPIMQRTIKEYLWGYQDPILSILKKRLPQLVMDDQISAFASVVNEAQYETILINNGVGFDENHNERINNLGKIERFNFSTSLSIWSNQYANMINGTDSTIWHPDARKDERIYTFMNDICRSVYLKYNQTHTNLFNINTYQYLLPNDAFANSSDNEGFCLNYTMANKTQQLKCLPSGLFSLTPCIHLSSNSLAIPLPIIASNPHFYAADQSVQDAVDGLTPDEMLHRSFMDIEPTTGIIMNGTRRMQFNVNVVNDSKINAISHIHPLVYPMFWVNEHGEIDKPNADIFHKKVSVPLTALIILKYLFLAIGILLFTTVIILLVYSRHNKNQTNAVVAVVVEPTTTTDETTPLLA
ncbi:unnamed protein product [Rotaria sordida]|uniref:Lysosome membrane protein 2 n=1 Tax=Rotaria sordida TaxID=392033 RepID=A0A814EPQ1_9BILA|nr:unnamed protein product [Rotaria sordida]